MSHFDSNLSSQLGPRGYFNFECNTERGSIESLSIALGYSLCDNLKFMFFQSILTNLWLITLANLQSENHVKNHLNCNFHHFFVRSLDFYTCILSQRPCFSNFLKAYNYNWQTMWKNHLKCNCNLFEVLYSLLRCVITYLWPTWSQSTVTFVHLYDWETGYIFWENPE